MFEAAELGRKIGKKTYKETLPDLRAKLLQAQFALGSTRFPVLIIVEGVDNASKGEVINKLNEWLDTRGLEVHAFGHKTDEEDERPRFWRYWRCLPAAGRIAIFSSSWYTGTIYQRTFGNINKTRFDRHMRRIAFLERSLSQGDMLILKFWLHMSKGHQKDTFRKLSKDKKQKIMVSSLDTALHKHYDSHIRAAEQAIRLTDQASAPWMIVEAEDEYYRDLTIAQTILQAVENLASGTAAHHETAAPKIEMVDAQSELTTVLDSVDLTQTISKAKYNNRLEKLQSRLTKLSWDAYHKKITSLMVFEGWDAGGKGGAIRRIMQAVDARIARVISIAAPTDEEKAHHYLWRFWRHIPRAGRIVIYDRSWYGRVLVERVEGFASENDWRSAYLEINDFEEQFCEHGVVFNKFWLHIDKDEQLARFKEREQVPYKKHKITDEDWRNREKWDEYEEAVNEMVVRTSTPYAPWTIVAGNDKKLARLTVLEKVCDSLERALEQHKKQNR
ncbi:MAG: polyphosphate:AMP phosphotransferase [Proteobacteria bacterium]|nr:MAG: polyphosphate:AMP phosphotransferase [Pseudomonadota bacterium]PIE39888.1 MAG: polyphosphate:AMP phosphotransferase [Gammaproteobacteria bacterium]